MKEESISKGISKKMSSKIKANDKPKGDDFSCNDAKDPKKWRCRVCTVYNIEKTEIKCYTCDSPRPF